MRFALSLILLCLCPFAYAQAELDACGNASSLRDVQHKVAGQLLNSLRKNYPGEELHATLEDLSNKRVETVLLSNPDLPFCLENESTQRVNKRFTYQFAYTGPASPLVVSGRYEHTAMLPVFASRPARGEIIADHHLTVLRVPVDTVKPGVMVNKEDIIGMAIMSGVFTNTPIYEQHLVVPNLVIKGSPVILLYQQGSLAIKTDGIVLDSAPKGGIVRVRNLRSNSIISGRVVDQSTVVIPNIAKWTGEP